MVTRIQSKRKVLAVLVVPKSGFGQVGAEGGIRLVLSHRRSRCEQFEVMGKGAGAFALVLQPGIKEALR